jgi:hypothetical protein
MKKFPGNEKGWDDNTDTSRHTMSVGDQRKLTAALVCSLADSLGYWELEPPGKRRKKVRAVKALADLLV